MQLIHYQIYYSSFSYWPKGWYKAIIYLIIWLGKDIHKFCEGRNIISFITASPQLLIQYLTCSTCLLNQIQDHAIQHVEEPRKKSECMHYFLMHSSWSSWPRCKRKKKTRQYCDGIIFTVLQSNSILNSISCLAAGTDTTSLSKVKVNYITNFAYPIMRKRNWSDLTGLISMSPYSFHHEHHCVSTTRDFVRKSQEGRQPRITCWEYAPSLKQN